MRRLKYLIVTIVLIMSVLAVSVSAYEYYYDSENYEAEYYDNTEYSGEFKIGKSILISLGVGLVISLIITGIMRSKMKSVRFENAARNYIKQGSMNIVRSRDMYLYSHVTKTPKPQNNNKKR